MEKKLRWYAVYTKPFWEKKVADQCGKIEIEHYSPVQKVVRQWSDRKKIIFEPLFKSYVFIRISYNDVLTIRQLNGVVNFVSFMGAPAVIRDNEIETIKQFLNDHDNVKVEKMDFQLNDKVKVIGGPFMNMGGSIVEIKNNTIKLMLPNFSIILSAEFKRENLQKTPNDPIFHPSDNDNQTKP
jgi:transcription antitermination factor NusG